jgi:hypothetical protein
MLRYGWLISTAIVLAACTSNEIGSSKDVTPETVYFDYRVWGDEQSDNVTVKLQYRFAGENGTTLVLEDPSHVELDGQKIAVDSSKMSGAYYEMNLPALDFAGQHTIVFTDMAKKVYKEEFDFSIISFKKPFPATINRQDLEIELDGTAPEDYVRLLLTDTSSFSKGIDRIDTIKDGRILISRADLENLHNGPISLEIIKEDEKLLKQATKEGGRLSLSYGLKREFELKDALKP